MRDLMSRKDESIIEALHRIINSKKSTGINPYSVLEDEGYTSNEIKESFYDPYNEDKDLNNFLDEGDSSPSNEGLGLNSEGFRDDD